MLHQLGKDPEADKVWLKDWARTLQVNLHSDGPMPTITVAFATRGLTDAEIEERSNLLAKLVFCLADYYEAETGDKLEITKLTSDYLEISTD